MATSGISASNRGDGNQNLNTGDGPQNSNNGKGLQINHSTLNFGPKETNVDEAAILRKEKEDCLRSLSFEYMDARKEDISFAHPQTCDWFFETSQFRQWRRRENLQDHNGVLWIKGHPGTGKSTLMKHTLGHLKEEFSEPHIIAAHFFNARGDNSEQTSLSMLRSLLYQLLEKEQSIYEQFVPLFRNKKQKFKTDWKWRESDLRNFLLSKIQYFQSKPLIVLVDALDECEEAYVRDVVDLLEKLSVKAVGMGVTLNICLSSRHYPHIGMKKHLELAVEERSEHNEDIVLYTRDHLKIRDEEIEQEFLEKASGVFMWAVLVIKMLNKAYDEGQIEAMHKMLHDVPRDLEQVFEALLIKDNPDKHETIFMIQFVLVARRLVKPEELYFATLAKTTERVQAWDQTKITLDIIRRRITNSSRGLIEIRKGEENAVQFIHKSVNDFLIRNKRLQKLDPDLKLNVLGSSHERLRSYCMTYIMMIPFHLATDRNQKETLASSYPFLEYASLYLLKHAEEADKQQIGQAGFLQCLIEEPGPLEKIGLLHNVFEEYTDNGCERGVSLPYMLAFYGYTRLTRALLDMKVNINAPGGFYGNALQVAAVRDKKDVVELLLKQGADVNAQGGFYGNALQTTAARGTGDLVKLLLDRGADVNAQGGPYGNALQAAIAMGANDVVELLLKRGADVNAQGGRCGNALQAAAARGKIDLVKLLLDRGADVNAQGGPYGNALQAAAAQGKIYVVELLLKRGADANALKEKFTPMVSRLLR
ncbi:ankyrin repeat-containing domain protein [Trichoderma sp. SZMC 28014]